MSVYWIPVIAIAGTIAMVIVIALAGARTKQRQHQLQADVQMRLIDRFGNADEFVRFIKSDEGKSFLGDVPKAARRAVLGGLRSGTILSFLGLAFFLCAWVEHDRDWFIPAFILLGLGIGFLVSALLSAKIAKDTDRDEPRL
jgi:hypothetical protein